MTTALVKFSDDKIIFAADMLVQWGIYRKTQEDKTIYFKIKDWEVFAVHAGVIINSRVKQSLAWETPEDVQNFIREFSTKEEVMEILVAFKRNGVIRCWFVSWTFFEEVTKDCAFWSGWNLAMWAMQYAIKQGIDYDIKIYLS